MQGIEQREGTVERAPTLEGGQFICTFAKPGGSGHLVGLQPVQEVQNVLGCRAVGSALQRTARKKLAAFVEWGKWDGQQVLGWRRQAREGEGFCMRRSWAAVIAV